MTHNSVKVAIVYHSGYGHTKVQAEAVRDGVDQNNDAQSDLVSTDELQGNLARLADADAIIFGSPTYMGGVSAQFKAFMDESSSVWMEQGWKNKIAAGFTNSSSRNGDKQNTLLDMSVYAAQHGMIWVGLGLPPGNNSSTGSEEDINRLGASLGAMAQSDADAGPEVSPTQSDKETAKLFGARVAEITRRFAA